MTTKWYAKTTNQGSPHEQGLIIEENTGANIAVSYSPEHGPLIAAAPELVEALKDMILACDHGVMVAGEHCRTEGEELYKAARAAIAKAKGEA